MTKNNPGKKPATAHAFCTWLLAGSAIALCAGVDGTIGSGTVLAAETVPAAQTAQAGTSRSFDIPAQPLGTALMQFGRQSGLQIAIDTAIAAGKTSAAVKGTMIAEEALRRLLAGSGLVARFTSASAVTIDLPQNSSGGILLAPVTVEAKGQTATGPVDGYVAHRSATGTKTDTPISEVPQSVSVVTRDQMDARGARSLAAALAYNAGVTTGMRGESSGISDDNIVIRGFGGTGSSNEYWDGLRIRGTNMAASGIEPYLFERVEVLRGPTSVLYGQNQPGGVVNSVSKRPSTAAQGEIQVLGGSFDTKELDADFGGPLTTDGDLSYRLVTVLSDQEGQTDFSGRERTVIAPSLSWRASSDTTLTLQSVYQKDDINGGVTRTLPAIGTVFGTANGKVPRERFTGDPNYDLWDREIYSIGYLLEHDISDAWSFRQNGRYLRTDLDLQMVYGTSLLADNRAIRRSAFGVEEQSNLFMVDNQFEGRFETGALSHTALFGIDVLRRTGSTFRRFAAAPTLDLYAPVYFQPIPEPPVFQDIDDEQFQVGLYVQDQIKIDKWILTLGARQDWAANETTNNRTATTSETDDDAFTGRIGLGYAFENGITPYVSFAQSFEPQSGIDFSGRNFEPTTGEQYEAGIKYDVPNHNAFLTLSAFELTQENLLTTDPDHPGFSVQTGEIRSRGIELEAVASLESGWDVIASYTYVDQEVTKSNSNDLGKRRAGIPRHTASFWGSYNFDQGWLNGIRVGSGVRYVSSSAGDTLNTFSVPSYMLFDASLNYDMSALGTQFEGWNASINATNLTDETYVASCSSAIGCYYGVGRSVIARLKYSW